MTQNKHHLSVWAVPGSADWNGPRVDEGWWSLLLRGSLLWQHREINVSSLLPRLCGCELNTTVNGRKINRSEGSVTYMTAMHCSFSKSWGAEIFWIPFFCSFFFFFNPRYCHWLRKSSFVTPHTWAWRIYGRNVRLFGSAGNWFNVWGIVWAVAVKGDASPVEMIKRLLLSV